MANISKMGFPILRLPLLAIFEVLLTMNPYEIINFSMSSLKCKKILKIFFRHSSCKLEVFLYFSASPTISIKGTKMYWQYKFTTEKKENNIVNYREEDEEDEACETLMKYSTNVVESFLNLFKYRIYSKEDVGNDVIDILNHVKGVKTLGLSAPFSKDFEIICPLFLHLLQITNSKWVNLKNLLEFKSSEIFIRDSELTAFDLCAFFQSWMSSESHLNLENFRMYPVKQETFSSISQTLPHEEYDDSVVRKIHYLQTWETLLEWFNIKRNDGTWATIYLTQHTMYPDWLTLGIVVG
ncbi:unnamed protein product [Caenorhabditis brenneri]